MLYKIVASLIDPGAKIAAEASKDVHAVMRLAVDASDAGMLYEFAMAAGAEDAALNGLIGTILGGVL